MRQRWWLQTRQWRWTESAIVEVGGGRRSRVGDGGRNISDWADSHRDFGEFGGGSFVFCSDVSIHI
jgi:hypothetical protein